MNKRILLILLPLLLLVAACDPDVLYNENMRIDEKGWNMDEELVFNFDAVDTSQTYLCCIDIRNRNDYDYSNIYLFIKTI